MYYNHSITNRLYSVNNASHTNCCSYRSAIILRAFFWRVVWAKEKHQKPETRGQDEGQGIESLFSHFSLIGRIFSLITNFLQETYKPIRQIIPAKLRLRQLSGIGSILFAQFGIVRKFYQSFCKGFRIIGRYDYPTFIF